MKDKLHPIILIFTGLLLIQITLVPFITVEFVGPDLLLILLCYYSIKYGHTYGALAGFIMGAIFDLASGGALGSMMFAKTLSGFLAGYFCDENKFKERTFTLTFSIIIFGIAIVDSFIFTLLSSTTANISLINLLFRHNILSALFTAAVSLPLILITRDKKLV
ncbi:MAG: rod shape-determining protein MreD [Melioribacteraceae bacterium]|nr:rod shape-determining protein MreD [Melioribacteraceae bacterium]MCF8265058.1 rod shape-determining protein MreD [Melioribacteraceae bacterium]MCF8412457.1 rod shape-determining protein MreD [Melioribacteraceae bacterium]MCF8431915.1 rod shape-determining protein MreD [Melioribacteraceae bacterium]